MQNAIGELYDALGRRGLTIAGEFGKKSEVVGPINKKGNHGEP